MSLMNCAPPSPPSKDIPRRCWRESATATRSALFIPGSDSQEHQSHGQRWWTTCFNWPESKPGGRSSSPLGSTPRRLSWRPGRPACPSLRQSRSAWQTTFPRKGSMFGPTSTNLSGSFGICWKTLSATALKAGPLRVDGSAEGNTVTIRVRNDGPEHPQTPSAKDL